jgi:hypothetical protein
MWCSLAGRLWIHAAAKVPDPDEITALEEFYRQLYETAGITAEFPQHYPTSALLGCVDCVNIVSNEEFRLMRGIHPSVRCWGRCLFIPIVNVVLLQVFAESESPYVFCCENPKVKRLCASDVVVALGVMAWRVFSETDLAHSNVRPTQVVVATTRRASISEEGINGRESTNARHVSAITSSSTLLCFTQYNVQHHTHTCL